MPKSYSRYSCKWCGRRISNNGLASSSHFKACKVRLKTREIEERQRQLGAPSMAYEEIIQLARKEVG